MKRAVPMARRARGFMLVDAVIGMILLGFLLTGLHQLRTVQMRGARIARARLSATETAGALALLTSLTPGATTDPAKQHALVERLRPAKETAAAGAIEVAVFPHDGGRQRVTARVPWKAGKYEGIEEVSAIAAH